jgi:hypothetical protein
MTPRRQSAPDWVALTAGRPCAVPGNQLNRREVIDNEQDEPPDGEQTADQGVSFITGAVSCRG